MIRAEGRIDQWGRTLAMTIGFFIATVLAIGPVFPAAAAPLPSAVWQTPEDGVSSGAAGRLARPQALAVNPTTGHVYVVEQLNARISEFDAWGQFIRAWGWGVIDGSAEFQICTTETGCQAGEKGSGPGQFDRKLGGGGLAVGPDGSVYVGDPDNYRIQKFSSTGEFLLAFGEEGTAPGQLQFGQYGTNLGVGPDGTVYIGENDRIQAFEPDGTFKGLIAFEGDLEVLNGRTVSDLAVDGSGNLYVTSAGVEEVLKLNPLGHLVSPESFVIEGPRSLSVDTFGNVYTTKLSEEVVEFDAAANELIPAGSGFADVDVTLTGLATSSACGIPGTDLYVAASNGTTVGFITAYGPPPDPELCPPPAKPPTVSAQFASAVSSDSAVVKARINPHFWPDTVFYVEYGLGKCSEGGCPSREPVADKMLTDQVLDKALPTTGISLPSLQPGTKYYFRFVAQSGGGGPVYGIDPDGEGPEGPNESDGLEGTFRTFTTPPPSPSPDTCPNAQFRTGPSSSLPDCRAYEMVSPADKGGGEIFTLFNDQNLRASLHQSAGDGESVTYSSYRSFGSTDSAPATSQYLASRNASGWSTSGISPSRGTPHQQAGLTLETQYRAFTDDLCTGWLVHDTDPALAPGAVASFPNLYRTDLCAPGQAYEALTTVEPLGLTPDGYVLNVQGVTQDGKSTAFRARGKLLPAAAATTNFQCYEHREGAMRLISVLPSGQPNSTHCSLGTAYAETGLRENQVNNAISEGGSHIFWTASTKAFGPGRIYARIDRKNPTLAVSQEGETVSGTLGQGANYWTAAANGEKVVFSTGNMAAGSADAYEFRLDDQSTHLIAPEVRGYLGSSEDASAIYLASEKVLTGANAEGKTPAAGKPNLYFYDADLDSFQFIAELSAADANSEGLIGPSPLATEVHQHTARVSADGRVAVFMSTAPLTGFDNTDANSGEPDAEVFRYDAEANGGQGQLVCVSCNPTGAAPSGRELTRGSDGLVPLGIWAAAQIPPWETQLHAPRVIPEEGERVIFESYEALVLRDTNAKQDVYQWSAVGAGGCNADSSDYSPPNGGCLSLISSGKSTLDSEFVDASADGRDVFFTTASSLVHQDPALIDLYDAREGGGFPPPPPPVEPCKEGECQQHGPAPALLTPASQQPGPGNVKPKPRPKCPKGKAYSKKKKRCVKKQRKHRHRQAGRSRGAAR